MKKWLVTLLVSLFGGNNAVADYDWTKDPIDLKLSLRARRPNLQFGRWLFRR